MFAISQDLMFWLGSWLAAHPERFSSLAIWKGCRFYCSLRRWWWASRHSVCIEYRVRGSGVSPLLDTHYTPAEYISSTTKCIIIIFSHFCFWIVHPCLTLINIAVFILYCQVAMIVINSGAQLSEMMKQFHTIWKGKTAQKWPKSSILINANKL